LTRELGLPETKARSIILQSVPVAQDCIKAQSKRGDRFEASLAPGRIKSTCDRVSKCIKRAPALLRRRLDAEIPPLIQNIASDLETIEAIFATTKVAFKDERFQNSEPSRTAQEALQAPRAADYSMLDSAARERVVAVLAKRADSDRQVKAAGVFAAIADALDKNGAAKVSLQSRDQRREYVTDLKKVWLEAGLRPTRSIAHLDDTYRSRFHRFVELVYAGMAVPSRHEDRRLADKRPWLALLQPDYKWEISDAHVRDGLKAVCKF
jgi:hypothetical protein